tara:strand:- start:1824 stop:2849 length:1026 start_codon:yes stop_codon:yes gene_type:complete
MKNSYFKKKKIFITGFNGFVGSWLVSVLFKLGAINYGYALNNNKKNEAIFDLKKKCKKIVYADIKDFYNLKKTILSVKPDFCIHLAAQPLVFESYNNTRNTFETNTLGTVNLLSILKIYKIPSIFISSDKTYKPKNKKLKEEDELGGIDPYSASKTAADVIINSYLKSFNLNIISCRAGNIIGGGDFQKNRLIPDITKNIFLKKKLVIRNIKSSRPWQHIFDVIFSYLKLLKLLSLKPKIYKGAWNIGPHKSYPVSIIIKQIRKNYNLKINYLKKKKYNETKYLSLNVNKSKKHNIKNKLNLEKSIKLTLDWYKVYYNDKKKIKVFTRKQIDHHFKNNEKL